MGQETITTTTTTTTTTTPHKDLVEGFCPACGEPCKQDRISHDPMCPFSGEDVPPEVAACQ